MAKRVGRAGGLGIRVAVLAASTIAVAAAFAACGGGDKSDGSNNNNNGQPDAGTVRVGPEGVRVRFDPTLSPIAGADSATQFLAFPFPADHRRTPTGTIRLSDFPNPQPSSLISSYIALGEREIDGFAANGAVHLAFDGPLDLSTLPTDPTAFLRADGPVQIVDITASSPEYGTRRPLRWEWRANVGKYAAQDSLAVASSWGFPLREKTTYALLMTSAVHDALGNPVHPPELLTALLQNQSAPPAGVTPVVSSQLWSKLLGEYAPVRALLAKDAIATDAIVAATVFTVQGVTTQLAAIRSQIEAGSAPALQDNWVSPAGAGPQELWTRASFQWSSTATVSYDVMEGSFASVNYQQGQVPYMFSGGALNFVNGAPKPVRAEQLRFVLSIPTAPPPGGGCYPIVEVSHGTGGDAYSFTQDGTAGRLAARGLAAIGIDQPLHGPRADGQVFDVNQMSFNFLNADSGRSTFRQGAIDHFVLTRFVRESLKVPANRSPKGAAICFDPARVGFFGHSQGGLEGAMAAGLERGVGTWMLSGAGGGMAVTVMERKDVMDISAVLANLLAIGPEEPLSELHPALTLIQTLTEVTDPINYGPYWQSFATFGAPQNVLMTSGQHDVETPYRTATALAVAARIPLVAPVAIPAPEFGWAGIATPNAPLLGNLTGGKTGGLLQWINDINMPNADTHFLVFYRPEAINASMRFLQSAEYEGAAKIERSPNADVR